MWRLLVPLLFQAANAFPTAHYPTGTCPHDALYTSLSSNGTEFCSSVIKYGHCNGQYSTPFQYATYNQTRISSSCKCILTNLTSATPTSGFGGATIHEPTTLTFRSGSWNETLTLTSESYTGSPTLTTNATLTRNNGGNQTSPGAPFTRNRTVTEDLSTRVSHTLPASVNGTSTKSPVSQSRGWNFTTAFPTTPPSSTMRFTILPFPSISSRNTSSLTRGASSSGQSPISHSQLPTFTGWNSSTSDGANSIWPLTKTARPSTDTRRLNSTSPTPSQDTFPTLDLTKPPQPSSTASTTSKYNSTSSQVGNSTSHSNHEFPAANFTRVTRTADVSQETCYHLPRGSERNPIQRAVLHNSKLREQNVTIPVPYIESIQFDGSGLKPLYLTVRDDEEGVHYMDVSNKSRIALVNEDCNTMMMDKSGIYFSSDGCTYAVSICIHDMVRQLTSLAGVQCAAVKQKRTEDLEFQQVINLHDQCGGPVDRSLREYPQLRVGDSACTDTTVDESIGRWEFDCMFPGSASGSMRCQTAIKNDVEDFLLMDPFGGACPDMSTVITTLAATGRDFLSVGSFRDALNDHRLSWRRAEEAEAAAGAYEQLWRVFQKMLSKDGGDAPGMCALEHYIQVYNRHCSLETDVCDDLHAGDMPLNLSLSAGVTTVDAITTLNWAPQSPPAYNITIQNPSAKACCVNSYTAQRDGKKCSYPSEAAMAGTNCVCGMMAAGGAVAFEYRECDNFEVKCVGDQDCEDAGHDRFVCLMGSCCGGGVCVDPYACSQNGTDLVKFGGGV